MLDDYITPLVAHDDADVSDSSKPTSCYTRPAGKQCIYMYYDISIFVYIICPSRCALVCRARWSLDARLANARQSSQPTVYFVGASTVAYMIFIMIVYMYNALTKRYGPIHVHK